MNLGSNGTSLVMHALRLENLFISNLTQRDNKTNYKPIGQTVAEQTPISK